MRKPALIAVLFVAGAALRAEPPKVIKAAPDNGDASVDPATAELRVVFDQDMDTRAGYSVVGGGPTFPQVPAKPKWENARTLVVPVKLEPDHDYWLSINSDRFTNCRGTGGEPATPYPIAFSTGPAVGAPPPADDVVARNRAAIAALRRAVDNDYAYRDLRNIDWDAKFREAAPRLDSSATPAAFARAAGALLAHAKDLHVWLAAGGRTYASHRRQVTPNFNPRILPRLVPGLKQHGTTVLTGRFDDGVVYVAVGTWERKEPQSLDAALAAVQEAAEAKAKALIVDVRPNSGGDELLARKFAGCFVDAPKVYSRNTTRAGGEWSPVYERAVSPAVGHAHYQGKVFVLMGPANMSSCESFLLMMKHAGATLVGERSYGSSGNPQPHDLGNGVTVYLSSWKDMLPDGTPLEGKGVAPDVEVKSTPADFASTDPILDVALKLAREQ
jgi:hypothetical protein